MIYLTIFLAVLIPICVAAVFYCIKFGIIILRVQDTLEDSLDIIDEKYISMTEICERPLFYDSPEVRRVLSDIKETRAALHQIAFSLSSEFQEPKELTEDDTAS